MPHRKKPLDAAQRVAAHRARLEADGGRQVAFYLSADALAKLDAIRARDGLTIAQVFERFLTRSKVK